VGRRARAPGPNKRKRPDDDNRGPARRQSLRVGTGKKGRGAELRQRRGSLRRRDRTAEKEAKEAAAIVRNTVQLPEYVKKHEKTCTSLTCETAFLIDERSNNFSSLFSCSLFAVVQCLSLISPS
jgi:hypothetical protein